MGRAGIRSIAIALLALLAIACSPRFDWRELRGPPGTFIVALPGKPQTVSREVVLPVDGASQRIEMSMLSTGVGASLFAVGTAELPASLLATPAVLEQTLAWFRDGLARNVGDAAPVVTAVPRPPAGLGGRRLRAAQSFSAAGAAGAGGRRARLAARLYVADDRFYQLVVIGAESEVPPQALETFFDSFRLAPP
jgi:hypothetical protein